ncbi:MAG: kynureninase [Cellvibrionaceae bacterium]|jgi:kynureninase
MRTDADYAKELDAQDPLAEFRDRFVITDPDLIYLDGNSLGRMPKATKALMADLLDEWGDSLIRFWGKNFNFQKDMGNKIAKLIGASPDEVLIGESTSINMYKLFVASLLAQEGRSRIVTDDLNFPSDIYILDEINRTLGNNHTVEVVKSPDSMTGPVEGIKALLDEDTALLTLSGTVFKSAYNYDMADINAAAKEAGALVVWDLSHSVGSVPVDLNGSGADMAIGCSYKYVNGGPGAPAFLYVRKDLQEKLRNPIAGWHGRKNQFDFGLEYEPKDGIGRFLSGTPDILSIAPIGVGVDLLLEAGMDRIREKSVAQTEFMIALWEDHLKPYGFTLNSPRDAKWRGSHIAIGHPDGWRINQSMIEDVNVLPDFRAPDNIRLGITPLYTTFTEIHTAVMRIKQIMDEKLYENHARDMPVGEGT